MHRFTYHVVAVSVLLASWAGTASGTSPADESVSQFEPGRQLLARTMERLELAERTLAFVQSSAARPQLAAELVALQRRIHRAARRPEAFPSSLYEETCQLRRRIILSHPALDFERLLINKRPPPKFNHQTDQYLGRYSGAADGLVILDRWKHQPRETVLLRGKLPRGSVLHPDLSFDAQRILFSYCDHTVADPAHRRFFIYEIAVDGTGLRQVTGSQQDALRRSHGRNTVLIEDWDPCYLPDGGFAFVSTRNQGGVRCHFGGRYCPTYNLYRGELDGSGIGPLSYGEANEWDPSVLSDGRIIWTRWDYINRHDTLFQSLWTTRPDGTSLAHFYGNYSRNPCSIAEARAIPGSHKVVATATAHHSYTAGSLILIDPYRGRDGEGPITRITPEVGFPETEGWPDSAYATPWPINEDLFLAAYSASPHTSQGKRPPPNDFAIYLIDTLGGRELIYRDPSMSCFCPIPIGPRPLPPRLGTAQGLDPRQKTGVFYVHDVYQSTAEIPRGSVKRLRVVRVDPQTTQAVPPRSQVLFETAKKILGTAPVAEDGSVAFRAPAGESLLFQLLDENGMSVMSMRTFTYLHPGEKVACVGCHEPRQAPPVRLAVPDDVTIHELTPPAGPQYEGGLSFVGTVQPVLDRYCIHCHGLQDTAGGLNLLGTIEDKPAGVKNVLASAAYHALLSREGLVALALRNEETDFSQPRDYFAHAGRLATLVLEGDEHHEKIDRESRLRVVSWLDLNAQFFGDYSWNKDQWRRPDPTGERALRAHILATFGPELAQQPYAGLVNVGLVSESRILKAPLAPSAGGWGQLRGGWSSSEDPGYQKMRQLVEQSITPRETDDIDGTCGRTPCLCHSCWVRFAQRPIGSRVESRKVEKPGD